MQAEDGQHRQHGVAQRVTPEHGAPRQALGAGGADEILAEHVDQCGARDAGKDRRLGQGERDGRQDQRLQRRPDAGAPARKAAGRHQPQPDGEDVDEQQREPEVRNRDAELRCRHGERVGRPAAARGGEDADRNGDRGGQDERDHRQRQRYGGAFGDRDR